MHLILGSRSPRRADLLRQAGVGFAVHVPPFEDPATPAGDADPQRLASQLAWRKARSVWRDLDAASRHESLVLGADTICVGGGGRLIGTPESAEQARRMLAGFVGTTHRVVSGAALIGDGVDERLADVAVVTWGQVSADTIDTYVASGEWAGKAGGYNLAERVAAGWPITVEGDPATVMGVPMRKLLPVLRELL